MDETKLFENFETAIPGVVSSKNSDGTVDVKPSIIKMSSNGVFDTENASIPSVPVLSLGGGQFFFSLPINVGDSVILIALSRDSTKWKKSDWDKEIIPSSCSGNTLCDFVAVPLCFKKKNNVKTTIEIDGDGAVTINGHLKVLA